MALATGRLIKCVTYARTSFATDLPELQTVQKLLHNQPRRAIHWIGVHAIDLHVGQGRTDGG